MKRSYLIILILICFLFIGQLTQAADILDSWIVATSGDASYQLTGYEFNLPTQGEEKSFSPDAQKQLFELANLFDYQNNNDNELSSISGDLIENTDNLLTLADDEVQTVNVSPLPGILIKADYQKDKEELKVETSTNINLKYQMSNKMMIRAGYTLAQKEWTNLDDITLTKDVAGDGSQTGDEKNNSIKMQPAVDSSDNSGQQGSLGISYQTSDKMTISADYVKNDIFSENGGFSTVLGLEYNDEKGKVRAEYSVDTGDSVKETKTGLELDVRDLATFSASYKLLNPEEIEETLKKESVWDFGIDFNLSEISSISLGYQLINNQSLQPDGNPGEENSLSSQKESNIQASFQIQF